MTRSFLTIALCAQAVAVPCTQEQHGFDYPYGDLNMTITETSADCCALCIETKGCVMYVWTPADTTGGNVKHCWLKDGKSKPAVARSDRVSGRNPNAPPAPAPTPGPAPTTWSSKYRNWHYYTGGDYSGFVIPPKPVGSDGKPVANSSLTDCSIAWQTEDGAEGGKYRMFYTTFDGTGYRTGLAVSPDLVKWDFSAGIIFDRNPTPGTFDYGGVTFGCPLYENASVTAPRKLQKKNGKYYVLYGAYPNRGHYESGHGAEGVAWSTEDSGLGWHRESLTIPILSVDGASTWEKDVIYQPNLVVGKDGVMHDFYNAHGTNAGGHGAEETGLATCDSADFPGIDHEKNISLWSRYSGNPVIASGTASQDYDTTMASDPKVWWDDELGYWVMFYFGLGSGSGGHADIMIARSTDLRKWEKDLAPLYKAGGHPNGLDSEHAHKISLIYDDKGVGYLYYTAVGAKGRGIALLTSKPLSDNM